MLTPNEEKFCINIEINKMSQYAAYMDAYPKAKTWKRSTVDENASRLANKDKILARRKELRAGLTEDAMKEAKWTRQNAFDNLTWLIDAAKNEMQNKGEISSAGVSAIINATKELNTIYAVMETKDGEGVMEEILKAVRGVNYD